MNGEASVGLMKNAGKLHHDPHPWDDLWRAMAVEHPLRDEWWDERDLVPLLDRINVPVYLGCDWENVPLLLPSTFTTFEALTSSPEVSSPPTVICGPPTRRPPSMMCGLPTPVKGAPS